MRKLMKLQIVIVILVVNYQINLVSAVPLDQELVNSDDESALDFILLHNNDLHGRFDESTIVRTDCRPDEALHNKCFGGFARISTVVKQYRNAQNDEHGKPVLFLNAGDTYVGTTWFFMFKDKIASEMMNTLKPDVGTLGNHEFDYGINGLVPFLNNINFPIAVANLDISEDHPLWKTNALQRSVVFNMKGFKIGVIGYILPETKNKSKTGDVDFLPEIEAINNEAVELEKNGVSIIIALGHSGYEKDQEIARECPLVDVVVGAHSHSFLYTGTPPQPDHVVGPYPTVVVQKNGKKVPVVQAYAYSKYLGKLELSFDKDGNLLRWSGLPILLDNQIPQDPEVLNVLNKYRPAVEALTTDIPATTKVDLPLNCRNAECNLGNLILDSWIYTHVEQYNGSGWTDASIAIMNGGGIRDSADIGEISRFKLSTILPFGNELMVVKVPGHVIKAALDWSVDDLGDDGQGSLHFLQMSGLRVVYDMRKESGHRVKSVLALCSNCTVPIYEKLEMDKIYGIIVDSFLYNGGDGYTMFEPFNAQPMNLTSLDATYNYIKHFQIIYPAIEGRVTFDGQIGSSASKASSLISIPSSIAFTITSLFFCQISFKTFNI